MSLLREIQDAAASDEVSVATLLRKCQILAARLGSEELTEWTRYELNGYPTNDLVPEYRIVRGVESCGNFVGPMGSSMKNAPIPVSVVFSGMPDVIETLSVFKIASDVGTIEDMLRQPNEQARFGNPWPSSVVAQISHSIYQNYACLEAWQMLPRVNFTRIIENVRSRILGFALDMEKENPNAGEVAPGIVPTPEPAAAPIFNQHFYGGVGNVATGSHDFSQQAVVNAPSTQQNLTVDLAALAAELPRLRSALAEGDPEQMAAAVDVKRAELEAEKPEPDPSKVKGFLKGAGKVAYDMATKIGASLAVEAIKQSTGLGSHH